jgi:hypothetical protein
MTHHEAELEFHNDVKAAMLNAWRNGLSKEDVRGNLLSFVSWMNNDEQFRGRLFSLYEDMLRSEPGSKPRGTPQQ